MWILLFDLDLGEGVRRVGAESEPRGSTEPKAVVLLAEAGLGLRSSEETLTPA